MVAKLRHRLTPADSRLLKPIRAGTSIDTVQVLEAVAPIATEWDALADRLHATPFVRPGWIQAWLDAFGHGDLRIYAVMRGGRLTALAPMHASSRAVSSPTNPHTPLFAPLAEDPAAASLLAQAILAEAPHRVHLGFLAEDVHATAAFTETIKRRGYRSLICQTLRSPYTDVQLDWEVFSKRLSRGRRKDLRRKHRQLADIGALHFDIQDGARDLEHLLAEGFAVEASGWKGRQATAVALNDDLYAFYRAIARWAADRGWLRLYFLRLDGRTIAFEMALDQNDVIYDLKGGYDEQYSKWSPGTLLMSEMVQAACAGDSCVIEWLGTDEPFKLEWSDGVRGRSSTTWLAPTVFGLAEYHWLAFWWEIRRHSKNLVEERLPEPVSTQLKRATARLRRTAA